MKITDTHIYFWGGIYSNWFLVQFKSQRYGISFGNSEQAFMYGKAISFSDKETADKILNESNPRKVKALGKLVNGFTEEEWNKVKFGIMVDVNFDKFSQNSDLKQQLLDTGNKTLVEASPYDKVWGVGLYEDDVLILDEKNWQGQNLLGKALMEVRSKVI